MSKFAVRSDMEGLSGVVSWDEVVPGASLYEGARARLHEEIDALCLGLQNGGAESIEIYDEHFFGLNLDIGLLRPGVVLYRGKPPYTERWPGGLDGSFSGLILQGYHAMAGTEGGILPHTYEPDIRAIRINERLVGEIGVEAAVAGEAGVPLVLLLGDAHGAAEAKELVGGVETVVVKSGMGFHAGVCRSWPDIREEILEKAARIAGEKPPGLLCFEAPIEIRFDLNEGPYRERLFRDYSSLDIRGGTLTLRGPSVSAVWAEYWALKDKTLASLKSS